MERANTVPALVLIGIGVVLLLILLSQRRTAHPTAGAEEAP